MSEFKIIDLRQEDLDILQEMIIELRYVRFSSMHERKTGTFFTKK